MTETPAVVADATRPVGGGGKKRILALDGGGVRGIVTVAFLERMEAALRAKTGNANLTLGRHFDLIGGTSVGSILATMLALDWPMQKVASTFKAWAPEIFKQRIGLGIFSAKFKADVLEDKLKQTLGDMRLEDPRLITRLAIVTKRLDTGSPWWIVGNIPTSPFWRGGDPDRQNATFRVADLIRASTAAPTVFDPKRLPIGPSQPYGLFVDGAVSPFNNPALALIMTARLKGHGLAWPLGADNLQMVSVGTGSWREPVHYGFWQRHIAAQLGVQSLLGMMRDSQALSLTLLQWMSEPRVSHRINSEIGDLSGEVLGPGPGPHAPLFQFQRYDLDLEADKLVSLMGGKPPSAWKMSRLRSLDNPAQLGTLYHLASKVAETQVDAVDFS